MGDGLTLDGRTAIVTGAGHGLGRAEAIALAAAGTRCIEDPAAVREIGRRVAGSMAGPGTDALEEYVEHAARKRVALAHAKALLATSPGVSAIWGDVREPRKILADVEAGALLDLSRPVVVLLAAILHFISDDENPAEIVRVFTEAMPAGSYLILSHATHDALPEESARARSMYRDRGASSMLATRSHEDIAAFFTGLELVEPGLVPTSQWRPPEEQEQIPEAYDLYAGVARKP